jgi:hypothetical protein
LKGISKIDCGAGRYKEKILTNAHSLVHQAKSRHGMHTQSGKQQEYSHTSSYPAANGFYTVLEKHQRCHSEEYSAELWNILAYHRLLFGELAVHIVVSIGMVHAQWFGQV